MNKDDDNTRTHIVLTKGTMVGHYRIVEKIGAGGMGEVYLVEDTKLNRKVALKFLPSHLSQNEDCRKRFKREAQAAAKLSHPNIIHVYEVSEYQGRPFFAMEHVEGLSLKEFSEAKDLSIERILELSIQICEGLNDAHEKGVTHRDIKPSNILVDSHGRVKIVDFGLASVVGTDQLTKTGSTLGTIGYMSPEQVRGKEIDHRSDLFSLGVVLYELITKLNPFKRDSEAATLKAVSDDLPEPLARFKTGLPDGIQAIVDKALEKDAKTRYQHADGMLSDLMRVKRSIESGESIVPISAYPRRSIWIWWIAAVVTVVVVAVILNAWMSRDEAKTPTSILKQITYFGDVKRCEISPDGSFYAYSREIGDHHHLYVSDLMGGNPVELLKCNHIGGFRWSPDGSELVVNYYTDSLSGILLIPRLGGESRKLMGAACGDHIGITWSPDGDRVAVHSACKKPDSITIAQVTPLTVSNIPLPVSGEWSENLDWSKDGNLFLVTRNFSTYNALWTISLSGQDPVELVNGDISSARWSADGSGIYYVERVGFGTGPLMKMRIDKNSGDRVGDPRILFPDPGITGLSISENNDVLFSRQLVCSNLWYMPIGEAGHQNARQLTFGTASAFDPAISPDGQSVIYVLMKDGRTDIYRLPLDGGSPQRLTFDGLHNVGPTWSPDGKEIAYSSSTDGHDYHIKVLNPISGKSQTFSSPTLANGPAFLGLHWGADGNIYYEKAGNRNIMFLNVESGAQRELIQDEREGWIFKPRVSPDGKSVVVDWNNHVRGPGFYMFSLSDTSKVCILDVSNRFFYYSNWSPDGEWLYCSDDKNLYRFHITGGKLDTLCPQPFEIDLSFHFWTLPVVAPDLGGFVGVKMDIKTDVWLIENFDPDID
ncbi:MAG: serine/threonine-protein kinase [FCB group bacterium]|nr:serine/threonine-protein kinase [FCB group bacterium]